MKKIEKKSPNAEKTERGDPLGFFNIHSVGKYQKIEEGPFGENFFSEKKVSQSRKILLRKLSKNCKTCKIVRIVRKSGPLRVRL